MNKKKFVGLILSLGWTMSLLIWIFGNSKEQMDMSNAGYQVFGSLGTVGFGLLAIIYFIINYFSKLKIKR